MDQPPATPPSWLPMREPLTQPPAVRESPPHPGSRDTASSERRARTTGSGAGAEHAGRGPRGEPAGWGARGPRRHRPGRTRRGAAGLAVVAAALLLWPFAGLSWIPWLGGFVALVLVRLLRLDGLLRGYDVHLAGLVVVGGLMVGTTPWAWALAASIGVLIAGLVQRPAWKLAAVGAVLTVLAGAAFVRSNIRADQAAAAAYEPVRERSRQDQGAPRPGSVLPLLLNRIAQASPDAVCDNLLAEPAARQFAGALGQPDCAAAVRALAARVADPGGYADADAPGVGTGDRLDVDACSMNWGPVPAGPQLGHLTIGPIAPYRYVVTAFRPC